MSLQGRALRTTWLVVMLAFFLPPAQAAPVAKPDRAVKKQLKKLRSANPEERAAAVYELGRLGPAAVMAAPDLIRLLDDETPVYMSFKEQQPILPYESGHAEPEFSYDEMMERSALGSLVLGVSGRLDGGSHHITNLGNLAARALGNMGPDVNTYLIDALRSPSPGVRVRVVSAIGSTNDPRAGKALTPLLQDPQPAVRRAAAVSLGLLGDPNHAESLIRVLRDSDADVRLTAFESLQDLRASIPQEAISELLRDDSRRIRLHVALATGADSVIASEAFDLLRSLGDEDWKTRERASKNLVALDDTCSVVQMVIDFLRDGSPSPYAIERANFVLGEISELKPRPVAQWQAWWDANKGASKKRPCLTSAGLP